MLSGESVRPRSPLLPAPAALGIAAARLCTVGGAGPYPVSTDTCDPEPEDRLEEPADRGTAHRILLALTHIVARSSDALLVFLPDHPIGPPGVLTGTLRRALAAAPEHRRSVLLLGVAADRPAPNATHIVPMRGEDDEPHPGSGIARVAALEEPRSDAEARSSLSRHPLWHTGAMVGFAEAFLALFDLHFAFTLAEMRRALDSLQGEYGDASSLQDLYRTMPTLDFNRDVLAGQTVRLRVLGLPPCGWRPTGGSRRDEQFEAAPNGGAVTPVA